MDENIKLVKKKKEKRPNNAINKIELIIQQNHKNGKNVSMQHTLPLALFKNNGGNFFTQDFNSRKLYKISSYIFDTCKDLIN